MKDCVVICCNFKGLFTVYRTTACFSPLTDYTVVQLTSLLAEIGLNIQEAHAFSTVDGYSLDVFVVDGWQFEVLSIFIFIVALFLCLSN